jgi:putative ABC transport system ATP-binding protein
MKQPLLSIHNLTKTYGVGDTAYQALRGIDLVIRSGELVAIMGPSGSGKSTLMNILGFLDTPSTGTYQFKDKYTSGYSDEELTTIRNKEIGFVFQSFNLLPRISVLENVMRPMVYAGISFHERQSIALNQLSKFGLADKAYRLPNQLSGGQIQRVAIARALVMNPGIILADEPTGNLDTSAAQIVMDQLIQANSEGHTIILITHSEEIARFAKRTIVIRDGLIAGDRRTP